MVKEVVVQPKTWSASEAYQSGRTACRIGITPINNPFKGNLADAWMEGWQFEVNNIPYSLKRMEYTEDRSDDRRSRNQKRTKFRKSNYDR